MLKGAWTWVLTPCLGPPVLMEEQLTFIEHLLSARHSSKGPTFANSLSRHDNAVVLISQMRRLSTER